MYKILIKIIIKIIIIYSKNLLRTFSALRENITHPENIKKRVKYQDISALMASRQNIMYEMHITPRFKNKRTIIRRSIKTDILKEIRKIKDIFGPIKDRDSRSVPFAHLIRLFDAVIKHARESEYGATVRRILIIVKKIKKTVRTLLIKIETNNTDSVNYAQAAHRGGTILLITYQQILKLPKENPIKEKQLIICISDAIKIKTIHKLFIRALIKRININMRDGQGVNKMITAH